LGPPLKLVLVVGRDAISAKAERLLWEGPGFLLRATAPAEVVHDLSRVRRQFGPPGAPAVVTGEMGKRDTELKIFPVVTRRANTHRPSV